MTFNLEEEGEETGRQGLRIFIQLKNSLNICKVHTALIQFKLRPDKNSHHLIPEEFL